MKRNPLVIRVTGTHRGAIVDGSRTFQRQEHRIPYLLRRIATFDGSRGFQPTVLIETYSSRRGATVDAGGCRWVAPGFMRRSATPLVFRIVVRGLKPTATVMRSLRDEEGMPMAAEERGLRVEKNLEGFGV